MTLIEHSRANEAAAHRHSTAEDASPYMRELNAWVAEIEQLAQPDSVVWIDGSPRTVGFSEKAMAFAPLASTRSNSATARSTSCNGRIAAPKSRCRSVAHHSSRR